MDTAEERTEENSNAGGSDKLGQRQEDKGDGHLAPTDHHISESHEARSLGCQKGHQFQDEGAKEYTLQAATIAVSKSTQAEQEGNSTA